jgi:argininosuccinate lyase
MEFNTERLELSTKGGYMTATDLADYLVVKQVPFRQAHAIVGKTVAYCIEKELELEALSLEELQNFSDKIGEDVFEVLGVKGSVASRKSIGGTSQNMVEKALAKAEEALGMV